VSLPYLRSPGHANSDVQATVQNADVIFVIGDGKVLEKGDHNALLRQKDVSIAGAGSVESLA